MKPKRIIGFLRRKFIIQPSRYLLLGLLYLISPVFRVKLFLVGQTSIGATVGCLELYLRRCQLGTSSPPKGYYAAVVGRAINEQVLAMYGRHLPVIRSGYLYWLVNSRPLRGSPFVERLPWEQDEYPELNSGHPVLSFTESEEREGKALLSGMGISEDAWFVCFHARDDGYWLQYQPETNYSTRTSFRNCSIENFIDAMKYIVSCGGYAVRVGAGVEQPLPDLGDPHIVDYASNHQTDFGDIYLLAKCKFLVGNNSGLYLISSVFNVPTAVTNTVPISQVPLRHDDLFIPKIIWWPTEKRVLTFPEILSSDIGDYWLNEKYDNAGLEPLQNSKEEVLAITKEMNQRLDGTFDSTEQDEQLQEQFQALLRPGHRGYGSPARLAATYLRAHQELFEPVPSL